MDLYNETNATIFYLRFIKAIMVSKDLKETLRMASELGIDYTTTTLLRMLKDVVVPHTAENSLPNDIAQNILTFVNICRFSTDEKDREERFNICNDILGLINSSSAKPPYPIYQTMINSYCSNFLERLKYHTIYATEPEVVERELSAVVELEYLILFFHSTVVDTEEFIQDISEELVLSSTYLQANDHLLRDDPTLLKDPLYLSRLSFILENNDSLRRDHQGNPDEDCMFELDPADEEVFTDKRFWKLHEKIKKKVKKARKDS